MELGVEFGITNLPTLLAFGPRRQEPRFSSRITDIKRMMDRDWLQQWVNEEAAKGEGGEGGAGGGLLGKLFS